MTKQSAMSRVAVVTSLIMLLLTPQALKAAEISKANVHDAELRPHMQLSYRALIEVLSSMSLDGDMRGAIDRGKTEANLKILSTEATAIKGLIVKSDKEHEFLAAELERTTGKAYARYKTGFRDQSKFYLSEIVNTCFGCHTSRTSEVDSRFAAAFSKDLLLDNFDSLAKARFLTLSRQFETAATAYETILLKSGLSTDELINLDPLVEYLVLTLRVKDDSARVLKTLKLLQTKNYPEVLKADIRSWVAGLDAVKRITTDGNGLERARLLIASAKSGMEFPRDRSGFVQYIVASKYLHEYLRDGGASDALRAQAYYDLGGCEMVLSTQFSADEASLFFAEVIRLAPKTDLARRAYTRYEENVLYGYSGSSGVHLPDDEKTKLNELKKLSL